MKIVCAWCKRDMGEKPPLDDERVSHGICDTCGERVKKKYARIVRKLEAQGYAKKT